MKNSNRKQLTLLGQLLLCLISVDLYAYDFEVDGIYYNITSNSEVEVTYGANSDNSYSEDVIVPNIVSYNNKTYTVSSIGNFAFQWCENLTSITLPNSIRTIGSSSFAGSKKCKSINIPEGVITIKDGAFYECTGLTSLEIPKSVASIDDFAFGDCGCNMESISVNANNSYYDSRSNCNAIIRKSDMKLLLGCRNTVIPNGVKMIGRWAFIRCVELKSINFPTSLEEIGEAAFYGCTGLTSLTIPYNVSNIYLSAFYGCGALETISVHSNNKYYDSRSNCNAIIKKSDNSLIRGCDNTVIPNNVVTIESGAFTNCVNMSSINLPNSITFINSSAFKDCNNLASINLPNNLKTIGSDAFSGCVNLASINLPNSLNAIGTAAFAGCVNLTSINLPNNLKTIGSDAFSGCVNLASINLPNSLNAIGTAAFAGCSSLVTIVIPSNVTTITNGVFYGCKSLQKITLHNSIKTIGATAFGECNNLTSFIIPNSATEIGDGAFMECTNLASITIPKSVTSIGKYVFIRCRKLSSVSSEIDNPFDITEDVFKNIAYNATLQVPKGTKGLYQAFNGWTKNFKEIVEEAESYVLSIKATGNGSASYNGTPIRGKTSTFTVNEGTSATITFAPDNGYRIKSVKVNNTDVTSKVSNNSYTISNISSDTSVEVIFEAITHTLSIKATGNGSVSYSGTSIREKTSTFTVIEGTSATITFAPVVGNRIKSVKVNNVVVTSNVTDNQYTISNISSDTSVEVEFEVIPPTTYTLSIKATGNGSVTYSGTSIQGKTSIFTVNEGTSATITFAPDNGYRIKSVKVNSTDVTSSVSNNSYTISSITSDTSVEVEFEAIPPTTYTLSIKATGNGSVTYSGTSIRGKTSTFTVNEGTSATITFAPDNGYRIKSVKVNNVVVTSNVIDNQYTISNISSDTSVEVEFEAIPTYTLKIASTGNGYATYNGTAVRSGSNTFTVLEGTSATISLTADDGYRVKSVKVNNQDVTASVANNRYIINNISANTTVEVTFEEIPPTTYTLSITATGNGSVTYGETTLKNQTQQFTVNEGLYATIAISPESGYRIKSVVQNGTDVTASVSNNQYTTSKITDNTSLEVTFELIPIPTYTLTITATGNGTAVYNTATIKNQTQQFTVNEGTSVTVMFNPDNGNSIKSVKVNGTEVTSEVSGNRYVISSMAANTTVEVEFKEDINALTVEGVNFTVTSQSDKSIVVAGGNYGQVLTVPATVTQDGTTWTVKGIDNDALKNNTELAAVIWNAEAGFTATVSNPNLLLYVKAAEFAPSTIKNVIVNGIADNITLMDASSGNGFYCPQAFTAQKITYTHYYSMTTGIGESRGWETIALPFDVQIIAHESKGTIVPFANWKRGDAEKPFWLYELTGSGFVAAGSIKAYTPYIISMPNNPQYDAKWRLNGRVTFTASSVTVGATENVHSATYTDRTFTPCFTDKTANEGLLALNVINDYSQERGGSPEGSRFIMNLRNIHPFEAYMTTTSNARAYIDVFEDMTTDIETIGYEPLEKEGAVYDLKGHKVKTPSRKGVYIINGKKQIIK